MIKPKFSHWSLVRTFAEINLKPNIPSSQQVMAFSRYPAVWSKKSTIACWVTGRTSRITDLGSEGVSHHRAGRQNHIDCLCFRDSSPDRINARVIRCSFSHLKGHQDMTLVRTSIRITYPSWYNIICSPHEREQEIQKGFWETASWRTLVTAGSLDPPPCWYCCSSYPLIY